MNLAGLRLTRAWGYPVIVAGIGAVLLLPLHAPADEAPEQPNRGIDGAVIPPGQEELFAAMLGRGAALPDGCTFSTGQIEQSVVRGAYECPGGTVTFELRHLSAAPADATRTEKLALVTIGGTPPAALLETLEGRIRQREGEFVWVVPTVRPTVVAPAYVPQCVSAVSLPSSLEPYFPACYPLFAAVLIGTAQTSVVLLGLGCGLLQLYRSTSRR
ncbi:MAG: hypothetical protein SF182_06990 [Deltaproteobacteria bacterium]|nr:hypothetical protein [Deltaproteobacteria bacterium]